MRVLDLNRFNEKMKIVPLSDEASYMFIKCPLEKQPELQPAISLECFMN